MTTLAEDYLLGCAGGQSRVNSYHGWLTNGSRIGQALFNALPEQDQATLQGTIRDPFYKNDSRSIELAVELLLDKPRPTI